VPHRDRAQPRALAAAERQAILDMLHSARFADTAPAEAWAVLLDEGTCLGSVSTFYRVLREAGESRERRAQAAHPAAVKPELAAAGEPLHDSGGVEDPGLHRTLSVPDLIIAATAELAGLTVLHLDKDFELVAEITGQPAERLRVA
jgi:predicted nucleic acid-binding protein